MKLRITNALICLLFVSGLIHSCKPARQATCLTYRGWDNCISISNGVATVIVNPTYGGHILYYGLDVTGENSLWADSVVNGWNISDYAATRRSPDAGRFDIGNERKTELIHDTIWAGSYSVKYADNLRVTLESAPSNLMGIKLERKFELEHGTARLKIEQTIENISDTPKEYCFWTRTLLPAHGEYYCTFDKTERYPEGYSEISLTTDELVDSRCDRVILKDNTFTAYPGGDEKKLGIFNTDGIYHYKKGSLLYTKQNSVDTSKTYDNNNGVGFPNMIYFNDEFIELEPNSPMILLAPNEKYTYVEIWDLAITDI